MNFARKCRIMPLRVAEAAAILAARMRAPVKTSAAAPERSLDQRMDALKRANDIRTARAKLKKDLKAGKASIHALLLDPPEYVLTAKVFDMLLAVPKYGRVKTNRILNQCRISPSKTIGGLSERQRTELVSPLRRLARAIRRAPVSIRPVRMAKVFVITGPSGVGKGTLIAELLRAASPTSSCRSRRRPASRARARTTGATTTSSTPRSSSGGSRPRTSSSTPPTAATATGRCAPRSSGASPPAARWCSRSRSRGRGRCAPRCRESVQIFIAPPDPAVLRERLEGAAPTPPRRSTRGCEVAEEELGRAGRLPAPVVNDDLAVRRRELEQIVRAELGLPLRLRGRMIKPRVDKLLEHADSHYAAVVVAAKRARQINSYFHNLGEGGFGEYPPPMVETDAERNYLSMALEELAEGKLKYEYRA